MKLLRRPQDGVGWCLLFLVVFSFALRAWAGSVGLDSSHNWDERFTLNNVKAFLRDGRLEPANAYYPSLSYLPQLVLLWGQQTLHRVTGAETLAVFGPHGFTSSAYLVCRWWLALCGALSVAMTFRVGRRVAAAVGETKSRWVGLVAALLVAALPVHVDLSAQIKPDVVVFLLALVAFDLGLSAVLAPSNRSLAWAGVGVGLAVAAKYTGVGAALPLVFGQLAWSLREGRRWKGLVVAGLVSLATFVVLNPFLLSIFEYLPKLAEIYQRKGAEAGGSHLAVFRSEAEFLFRHHGGVIGGLAIAGVVWLLVRFGRSRDEAVRRAFAMVLAWPIGYSLLYGFGTTLFKGQNYLPVAAFTAISAALLLVFGAGEWLHRLPGAGARWGLVLVSALGAVWVLAPSVSLTYGAVVPTTYERAAELLKRELAPVEHHTFAYERRDQPLRVSVGGSRPGALVADDLTSLGAERLDLTDAEVFLASRLDSPAGDFLRSRMAAPGVSVHRFGPRLGRAHGPEVVAIVHPWRRLGEPESLALSAEAPGRYVGAVSPRAEPIWASLSLMVPLVDGARVRVAGHLLPLLLTQRRGGKAVFLTPRFELPAGTSSLTLELPDHPAPPAGVQLKLVRWLPPSG